MFTGKVTNSTSVEFQNFANNLSTFLLFESENVTVPIESTRTYTISETLKMDYTERLPFDFNNDSAQKDYTWFGMYISMGVVGIVVNIFIMLVLIYGTNVSKEVKIQLIHLAVADLLMSIFDTTHLAMIMLRAPFPANTGLCKLYRYIRRIAHGVGLLISVVISIERFVIFYFPFKMREYTNTHKHIAMSIAWICAALAAIIDAVNAQIKPKRDVFVCRVYESAMLSRSTFEWLIAVQYILPSLIIVTLYTLVFVKIYFQQSSRCKNIVSHKGRLLVKVGCIFCM